MTEDGRATSDDLMPNSNQMPTDKAIRFHVEKLAQLTGIIPPPTDRDLAGTAVQHNPLGHLDFLMSIEGKNENDDYDYLVGLFRKHGIEPGDIRKDSEAWCGKGLRLALVASGHADPGERYNRAMHWAEIGEEAIDPNEAGVIVVYRTHVGVRTHDGGEAGCNVGNSVKVMPKDANWFGQAIAHRKIA